MPFRLEQLVDRFDAQANTIAQVLQRADAFHAEKEVAEYALVALQDSWSRFVRDLILQSSIGAVTASGTRLPRALAAVSRQLDALSLIRSGWKTGSRTMPVWWEPRWYDPNDAVRAVSILSIPNRSNVLAALGSSTNPIGEVRPIRNFAVHRLPNTSQRVDQLVATSGWSTTWLQPRDLVLESVGPPDTRFDVWCRRFHAVANAAVMRSMHQRPNLALLQRGAKVLGFGGLRRRCQNFGACDHGQPSIPRGPNVSALSVSIPMASSSAIARRLTPWLSSRANAAAFDSSAPFDVGAGVRVSIGTPIASTTLSAPLMLPAVASFGVPESVWVGFDFGIPAEGREIAVYAAGSPAGLFWLVSQAWSHEPGDLAAGAPVSLGNGVTGAAWDGGEEYALIWNYGSRGYVIKGPVDELTPAEAQAIGSSVVSALVAGTSTPGTIVTSDGAVVGV